MRGPLRRSRQSAAHGDGRSTCWGSAAFDDHTTVFTSRVYWARAEYEKGKARASPFSPHGFANPRSHQGWWLKRNHHGTVKPDHSCGETREGLADSNAAEKFARLG